MQVLNGFDGDAFVSIDAVTSDCYDCRKPNLCNIPAALASSPDVCWFPIMSAVNYVLVDVRRDFDVDVRGGFLRYGALLAHRSLDMQEHGAYTLVIHAASPGASSTSTTLHVDAAGHNSAVPLLVALGVLLGIAVVYKAAKTAVWWLSVSSREGDNDLHQDRDFIVGGKVNPRALSCDLSPCNCRFGQQDRLYNSPCDHDCGQQPLQPMLASLW